MRRESHLTELIETSTDSAAPDRAPADRTLAAELKVAGDPRPAEMAAAAAERRHEAGETPAGLRQIWRVFVRVGDIAMIKVAQLRNSAVSGS